MWNNLRKIADVAATIGGVLFAWNVALGFAEAKVRAEFESGKRSIDDISLDDVVITTEGDTIKIRMKKKAD